MDVGTGDSSVLRQVTLAIVSDEEWCQSEDKICARPKIGNKDTCFGDSGGPLVCKQGDKWYQYGIVGYGCSFTDPSVPTASTDVAYFIPWIEQQTGRE